ncbi:pilus assembly protein PilO [Lyngbya confervoides]|uniref:Pilus assembly protein PilO n=1 Tax=Lyngbya confervoides BDU141951 TaxID=1574623 RepID=A0ABD4SYP8_9CYAN|nr:pilus assembly protein PilO [Lyngbya confervoides]MCM1981281.1 pilus assembly protein PilO [Lyngbya confervoides BDU141951]
MTTGAFMEDGFDTPSYPVAFGVTLTPQVLGVLAAIGGVALAGYIGVQLVGPQLEQNQQAREAIAQKELDLSQKEASVRRLDELVASLNQVKDKREEVRELFSSQKALDTLLLDLNRVISTSNAQLMKFTPNYEASGVVADGSLGPELNYKLKRQVTDVSFQGTFDQTLRIMQAIDRLQTVLVVQELKMEVGKNDDQSFQVEPEVSSSFQLYAYVPLTPEEAAAAQQQAEQAKQNQDQPN